MSPLLLGIDAGTSSVKACVFDHKGNLIYRSSIPVTLKVNSSGNIDLDLESYWVATVKLIRQITEEVNDIEGVGFSVTSPTTVLLSQDCNAVRPGIPYLDTRGAEEVRSFTYNFGGIDDFFQYVGNRPIPSTCAAGTMRYLQKQEPENWYQTVKVGFLNTYLAAKLTSQIAIDPTVASFSGLVRLDQPYRWDDSLVKTAGIPMNKLPPIIMPYAAIGKVNYQAAKETGLAENLPVALGCADTAAAAFALGIRYNGDVFESAGTSDVLCFCLTEPCFNGSFLNRAHVFPDRWLALGAMATAGACIDWMRNNIFPDLTTTSDLENEAAISMPGAGGILFLPYLSGERSPIFDPAARGMWFGLHLGVNRSDLVRAAYEGIAFGLKQILEIACKQWNFKVYRIPCVGGAAKSKLGLQIRADILETEYIACMYPDAAALGAAILGGIAAGVFDGPTDHNIPFISDFASSVHPNKYNQGIYKHLFDIYKELYNSTKEQMHQLP